jgi:hypothetical protein
MAEGSRTPDQIRGSIDRNREQLATSLVKLRGEVSELTDWRSHLRQNQGRLAGAAAAAGFVLAGGIGGLAGALLHGGRRRRRG